MFLEVFSKRTSLFCYTCKLFMKFPPGQVEVIPGRLDHRLERVGHHLVERRGPGRLLQRQPLGGIGRQQHLGDRCRIRHQRIEGFSGLLFDRRIHLLTMSKNKDLAL